MAQPVDKIQTDALEQASQILQEPSRNTKRNILISINLVLGLLFGLHTAIQLITVGRLPFPVRDNVMLPLSIIVFLGSAGYNISVLLHRIPRSPRWDRLTQWSSVLVLQGVCLAIVHVNPNTATSLLIDHTLSIITIVITGVILGRGAAVVWCLVTIARLVLAMYSRGTDFTYFLMLQDEVTAMAQVQARDASALGGRLQAALAENLLPLPITLFVIVSIIFTLVAILVTYFEAGMIGKVLNAIPAAIDKIEIGAKEKEKLAQENIRLVTELDVARRVQTMILPHAEEFTECEGLEVAARMDPATEVGGDLYEVLPRPDGSTVFAIGDVTDHGLTSGIVMLMSQTALRTCLETEPVDLVQALVQVNSVIFKNVQARMDDDRNLTLALLHYKDGRVRLAGQHESVMVVRKGNAEVEELDTLKLGINIGLIEDVSPIIAETSFELGAGDLMALYTDGVTEAENPEGKQYGLERFKSALMRLRDRELPELMDQLFEDLFRWIGRATVYDDITLMLVRRNG